MAMEQNQIVHVGLAAGLLMNVAGWIGNQLVLGPPWKDAIQTVVPTYLGIANSALLPVGLAAATTLVGLVSAVPTAWLVWKWLPRQAPGIE